MPRLMCNVIVCVVLSSLCSLYHFGIRNNIMCMYIRLSCIQLCGMRFAGKEMSLPSVCKDDGKERGNRYEYCGFNNNNSCDNTFFV